jgi:arsenical pump membrane protein
VIGAPLASHGAGGIVELATAGVIARPFAWQIRLGRCRWLLLLLLGLLSPAEAWSGAARGTDLCLFLVGLMLLSKLACQEGLFDWLAARAAASANGAAARLFTLSGSSRSSPRSNDATAVVLTPGVAARVRAAEAKEALPYLLICAYIVTAASFVLPISMVGTGSPVFSHSP